MAGLTADLNEAVPTFIERRTATVEKSSGRIQTRNGELGQQRRMTHKNAVRPAFSYD